MLCIVENLGLKHEMFDGKPQKWYMVFSYKNMDLYDMRQ